MWGSPGLLHPVAATKAEQTTVLHQQHFLTGLDGAAPGAQFLTPLLLPPCRGPH